MKVVQINVTCGSGSTGKIAQEISMALSKKGIENYVLFSEGKTDYPLGIKYTSFPLRKFSSAISHLFGRFGFEGMFSTINAIKIIKKIQPDIIQIHNIHGHAFSLNLFYSFVKKTKIKIVWTFHDCWAFTGYCTYFDFDNCNRWLTQCNKCPQRRAYSFFFDKSKQNYLAKKTIMCNLPFTIISPSTWLSELVKRSFLSDKSVTVINNGIDTKAFSFTRSTFKKDHGLEGKIIILGVAFNFEKRKGLADFIKLRQFLNNEYAIVLVGNLPKHEELSGIIAVEPQNDRKKLAEIYSCADVFFNPTYEDNYPTCNLESISCGTPVVTYDTGGSPETIDCDCGLIAKKGDMADVKNKIETILADRDFFVARCVLRKTKIDSADFCKNYLSYYTSLAVDEKNNQNQAIGR